MLSSKDDAIYHLVDRGGTQWPAVQCAEDMIPAHEVEARPSSYHLPVLLLPSLRFTWILNTDTHEFDPAAEQNIPNGSQQEQLREGFTCVLGSDMPGHPAFPDLGYWRSEIVARDLQNITTSSSEEPDNSSALPTPRSKKNMPPAQNHAKRPWERFKKDKEFGEEFGHANKKVKVNSHIGKHTHQWFPDENDNHAKPPPGYFERLRKEKREEDMAKEDLFLSMSEDEDEDEDEDSESDSDTNNSVTSDSSGEDGNEETELKPVSCARRPTKRTSVPCVAETTSSKNAVHTQSTSSNRTTAFKSPSTKPDQSHNQVAITQRCMEFDTARAKSRWDQARTAVSQLLALGPWSDDSTILVAKAAFRIKPSPDLDQGFEHSLREAVAEHIGWNYERLRATRNSMVAMLLRDHEDLAEMVYEWRLKTLREKRAEVIEIIDSDND